MTRGSERTRRPRAVRSGRRRLRLLGAIGTGIVLLCALALASVLIGSRAVAPSELGAVLTDGGSAEVRTLLGEVRLPRTIAGILVGVALASAGTLMQGMTRNPLADPGLLGVSAGSAFAVVIGMTWFGMRSATGIAGAAVGGAAVMTAAVFLLGVRGRGDSGDGTRLVLAGVAFSMTVTGVQSALTLLDPRALDAMRAWSAGSLASPDTEVLARVFPVLLAGAVLAAFLVRPLNALALGDELARGLGSHPLLARIGTGIATACLVGAATAIAGPIGFIGLMVPHIIRPFTGPHTGRLLAVGTIAGACLMLAADVLARVVLWPGELPVGVVAAAIGAPVILTVLRKRGRH